MKIASWTKIIKGESFLLETLPRGELLILAVSIYSRVIEVFLLLLLSFLPAPPFLRNHDEVSSSCADCALTVVSFRPLFFLCVWIHFGRVLPSLHTTLKFSLISMCYEVCTDTRVCSKGHANLHTCRHVKSLFFFFHTDANPGQEEVAAADNRAEAIIISQAVLVSV